MLLMFFEIGKFSDRVLAGASFRCRFVITTGGMGCVVIQWRLVMQLGGTLQCVIIHRWPASRKAFGRQCALKQLKLLVLGSQSIILYSYKSSFYIQVLTYIAQMLTHFFLSSASCTIDALSNGTSSLASSSIGIIPFLANANCIS